MTDAPTPDTFVFGGENSVDGHTTFEVTWTATGPVRQLRPTGDPNEELAASFRNAAPSATFSGSNADGFSFTGSATPDGNLFTEFGHERNGSFLK